MDVTEKQGLLEQAPCEKPDTSSFSSWNRKKLFFILIATVTSIYSCFGLTPTLKDNIFDMGSRLIETAQQDVCVFPTMDYFDPEIMEYYKNVPVCQAELLNITVLQQGKLLNNKPNDYECWGRCLTFKNGNETTEGEWYHTNQSDIFPCDIVESRCSPKDQDFSNSNYFFIHTQIVELSPKIQKASPKSFTGKQYDVYFIVVDSQAHSQLFRNLNKTNDFLLNEMKAVSFPYLNKVGDGSLPNGFAWFYGKITEHVDRSPYNLSSLEPEPAWKNYCTRDLDNETMIIREFEDYGYMTSHVADWWRTIDYGCIGAKDKFAEHTYTPYAMTYEYNPQMINFMSKQQCIHRHQHALDYLGQFVDAYKNKPKMAFVWLSHVGHNTERGSTDADQHFVELFQKHKSKFDDSFVFLTGDHGLRHSTAINTKVGSIDLNNPALMITLPEELRNNEELMKTLRENAKELQTHYDTRATLLDILKFQPAVNYSDRSLKPINGELGNSLLRQQPKPRTCRTLPIPSFYCICENQMKQDLVKKNPQLSQSIGKQAIDLINLRLSNDTVTDKKCRKWIFQKTIKLEQFSKKPSFSAQGSFLVTNDRNLQASFKIFMAGPNETSLQIDSLARVDEYKDADNCVRRNAQSICDCY